MTTMDKDKLAAFVDGELSPEDSAAAVLHLADHPDDQAYVDDLFAANAALAQAFAAPLHEPVPEAIRATIMGTSPVAADRPVVVPFRPRQRAPLAVALLALAASVVAAAVLVPGLMRGPEPGLGLGPLAAAHPVKDLLETGMSGVPVALADGREAMVLATFAMPDGRYCREFELVDAAAGRTDLAMGCRAAGGWTVEAAVAELVDPSQEGFMPAEGVEAEALTRLLEREGPVVALDAAAEAKAISNGWTAP